MSSQMRELIQRQRRTAAEVILELPPGVPRAPWLDEHPAADPYWTDERHHPASGWILGRAGGCRWIMAQMGFGNWRLLGVPEECEESSPEYGWCFHGPAAVVLAVNAWDPEIQDEPLGWHKRAGSPRRARMRHKDLTYNRPRCVHGSYFADGQCAVVKFCEEFREGRSR